MHFQRQVIYRNHIRQKLFTLIIYIYFIKCSIIVSMNFRLSMECSLHFDYFPGFLSIVLNSSFIDLMSPALYLITVTTLELIAVTTLLEFSFNFRIFFTLRKYSFVTFSFISKVLNLSVPIRMYLLNIRTVMTIVSNCFLFYLYYVRSSMKRSWLPFPRWSPNWYPSLFFSTPTIWVSVLTHKVIMANYLYEICFFLFSLFPTFVVFVTQRHYGAGLFRKKHQKNALVSSW